MATPRVTTVPVNNTATAGSFSVQASMKALYPQSPIHNDELNPEALRELAQKELLDGTQLGNSDFPEGVSMDFEGVPNLEDVEHGGGAGDPTTPFVPNLASPGEGSIDAATQPANDVAPVGTNQFGSGTGTTEKNLQNEASKIASNTIGNYPMGRSSKP